MKFSTKLIHSGRSEDAQTGAVVPPIYQTSTFSQESPGSPRKFLDRELSYSRTENPTRALLENAIASLEDAGHAVAFGSGMAAVNAVLNTLSTGDHVIAGRDLYGGSYRIFTKLYAKFGVEFTFTDITDQNELEKAFQPNTKIVWLESPSNPLLNIVDLEASCQLAKEHEALSVVDNTFATPCLQNPLKLGADIVLHSTTKYINGHYDVVNGALVTDDEELFRQLKFYQNAVGSIPGPQDCFLVLRGIPTLELRVKKHCENARKVAEYLNEHRLVKRVYFPGLETHPGHEIARKQMNDFGGMVSFELDGDVRQAKIFLKNLKLFTLAESLGGIKSLICHPPTMTHAAVEPEVRHKAGIADGLIRASIGIEDADDLIEDLANALDIAETSGEKPAIIPV